MSELHRAIDLALAGDWDAAHRIVQNIEDPSAYWLHAILHKIEGDLDNSRYWYRRAGRLEHLEMNPEEELALLRQSPDQP